MERGRTPRVRPNGHTPGVRCLVASKNIKGTRRGGSPLLVVSNKVKQTRRIKSNRRDEEGRPSSSRRIKSNKRGGSPLFVASNGLKQTRQGGETLPVSWCGMKV